MAWTNADHIAPQGGSYEPARGNSFTVWFERLGDAVELAVVSSNLPDVSHEEIAIQWMNETRKVAGKISIPSTSVTIGDYVEPDIASICQAWRDEVGDIEAGTVRRAAVYKSEGLMTVYDTEGVIHSQWRLIGCWPQSFTPGSLDYGSGSHLQISMSIAVDKAVKVV